MIKRSAVHRYENRRGFTAVELLVTMVLSVIVLAAVVQVLISQSKLYRVQREAMDARESLRAAGALLSWELMGSAATNGDIYSISPDSVTLRSLQASGVVCATKTSGNSERFGLQLSSGSFPDALDDSALVYSGSSWGVLQITKTWGGTAWDPAPGGGGTAFCFWGDTSSTGPRPQVTVELSGDSTTLANMQVGSPIRAFQRTHYGLFQQDGRWWLGRRVDAGAYEILTGPMQAPADSGLIFTYYDAAGAVTTDPTLVAEVDIVLRSQSYGPALSGQSLTDSLTLKVALRNNTQ